MKLFAVMFWVAYFAVVMFDVGCFCSIGIVDAFLIALVCMTASWVMSWIVRLIDFILELM